MINWKKEGYLVGEEVLLVSQIYFSDKSSESTGIVKYVGVKKLVVELEGKQITFNQGSRCSDSNGFGMYYFVYKDKEEHETILTKIRRKDELKECITQEIKDLSLKSLEKVYNCVKEEKEY